MNFYQKKLIGINLFIIDNTILLQFPFVKKSIIIKKLRLPQLPSRRTILDHITGRTVYFYESGTDCDGCESGSRAQYYSITEANRCHEDAYKWADGPFYNTRITKAEYDAAESYFKDHYAQKAGY